MTEFVPIAPAEITRRWLQARAAANLLKWRALRHLFVAEQAMCAAAGLPHTATDMAALAAVAHQHALDLQPQAELEAA